VPQSLPGDGMTGGDATGAEATLNQHLAWMREGSDCFERAVAALGDGALSGPSRLPGWDRRHVMAHVVGNAEGLGRLAEWAATGTVNPMYASSEERLEAIEATARLSAGELRARVDHSSSTLDERLAALQPAAWDARVTTATGREVPAREIPWIRSREIWLHAVDLDSDVGLDDLPPALTAEILDEVLPTLTRRGAGPLRVRADDLEREWTVGDLDDAVAISGAAVAVLGWAIGRADPAGLVPVEAVPTLERWL